MLPKLDAIGLSWATFQVMRTDEYWKRVAERDRHGIGTLENMLRWAQSTRGPSCRADIQPEVPETR